MRREKKGSDFSIFLLYGLISFAVTMGSQMITLPSLGHAITSRLVLYPLFFFLGFVVCRYSLNRRINLFISVCLVLFHFVLWECNIFGVSSAVFGVIGYFGIFSKIQIPEIVLGLSDRYSFALYLYHLPIIYLLLGLTDIGMFLPIITIITLFVVSFGGSLIFEALLKYLKGILEYLYR